jgi:hypothetical protein
VGLSRRAGSDRVPGHNAVAEMQDLHHGGCHAQCMPVETAVEQTEVASINIDERSLALRGGQVERQALDLGDPDSKVLRCSISSQLDGRTGVSVGGITGNTYHHEPVPVVVVVIVRGARGTAHFAEAMKAPPEGVKLVGNLRRTAVEPSAVRVRCRPSWCRRSVDCWCGWLDAEAKRSCDAHKIAIGCGDQLWRANTLNSCGLEYGPTCDTGCVKRRSSPAIGIRPVAALRSTSTSPNEFAGSANASRRTWKVVGARRSSHRPAPSVNAPTRRLRYATMPRARERSAEAQECSKPHAQQPGWGGTGGTQRASRQNSQRGERLRTARDTGVADHRRARGLSPRRVAMRADPANAQCGTEGDVYARVSRATGLVTRWR